MTEFRLSLFANTVFDTVSRKHLASIVLGAICNVNAPNRIYPEAERHNDGFPWKFDASFIIVQDCARPHRFWSFVLRHYRFETVVINTKSQYWRYSINLTITVVIREVYWRDPFKMPAVEGKTIEQTSCHDVYITSICDVTNTGVYQGHSSETGQTTN